MNLPFVTELHPKVIETWPNSGSVILASYDTENIIVYQAFKPEIANWASQNKTFVGCPDYQFERMTWIKTNFLWMMYRSGWASKPRQEHILAISIKRSGFLEILREAKTKPIVIDGVLQKDDVRLQWDPDHNPYGEKMERRAIQLGLRREILHKFLNEWITDICDITPFVHEQRIFVENRQLDLLRIPFEKVFIVEENLPNVFPPMS